MIWMTRKRRKKKRRPRWARMAITRTRKKRNTKKKTRNEGPIPGSWHPCCTRRHRIQEDHPAMNQLAGTLLVCPGVLLLRLPALPAKALVGSLNFAISVEYSSSKPEKPGKKK